MLPTRARALFPRRSQNKGGFAPPADSNTHQQALISKRRHLDDRQKKGRLGSVRWPKRRHSQCRNCCGIPSYQQRPQTQPPQRDPGPLSMNRLQTVAARLCSSLSVYAQTNMCSPQISPGPGRTQAEPAAEIPSMTNGTANISNFLRSGSLEILVTSLSHNISVICSIYAWEWGRSITERAAPNYGLVSAGSDINGPAVHQLRPQKGLHGLFEEICKHAPDRATAARRSRSELDSV